MDISQFLEPKRQNTDPRYKYYNWPKEIDYYEGITQEKKDLLRSVYRYLNQESFTEILQSYNDYENPIQKYGYVQFMAENGVRTLNQIELFHSDPTGYSYDYDYYVIQASEVSRKYHRFPQYGSQDFYTLTLRAEVCEDFETTNIIYDKDGNIFISDSSITGIARRTAEELGRDLANYIKFRIPNEAEEIQKRKQKMIRNYRNCQ